MESIQFHRKFSIHLLLKLLVFAALTIGLVIWKKDFISDAYIHDQLTPTGLIINGGIIVLFLLGLFRMIVILLHYAKEESALNAFINNTTQDPENLIQGVQPKTIIARRYRSMVQLSEINSPVNHAALASTLVASESTRTSLLKYIHNVLILTGVFGTIISLSIALVGASDMLESTVNTGGMGMVIHGMSTALSTTITAILCYLFFGYFYLKLTDAQTNLISGVEQVTTNFLIPQFHVEPENILYEFSGLIRSIQGLVTQMETSQSTFNELEQRLLQGIEGNYSRVESLSSELSNIRRILARGFRLTEGP